jgi:hypothetical protein
MGRDGEQGRIDLQEILQNFWGQNIKRIRVIVMDVAKLKRSLQAGTDRYSSGFRNMAMQNERGIGSSL